MSAQQSFVSDVKVGVVGDSIVIVPGDVYIVVGTVNVGQIPHVRLPILDGVAHNYRCGDGFSVQ